MEGEGTLDDHFDDEKIDAIIQSDELDAIIEDAILKATENLEDIQYISALRKRVVEVPTFHPRNSDTIDTSVVPEGKESSEVRVPTR